jgi:hypothetical protein
MFTIRRKWLTILDELMIKEPNIMRKTARVGDLLQVVKVAIDDLDTINPAYDISKIRTDYGKY